jgi:hypothetical protein
VAALTPLSVDGMIVAASSTLLAESRSGGRGGVLPWALLVAGSAASLANVAVAEPTVMGRLIAAWPSFALICSYELLMRHVRCATAYSGRPRRPPPFGRKQNPAAVPGASARRVARASGREARDVQLRAWEWAVANRSADGVLPSGKAIAAQFGRRERWGRLVKRRLAGIDVAGALNTGRCVLQRPATSAGSLSDEGDPPVEQHRGRCRYGKLPASRLLAR